MTPSVTGLFRYPVKSLRGQPVPAAQVQPWGLAGDRTWMVVLPDGTGLTARERPELLLVTAEPTDGGLRVLAHGRPALEVAEPTGPADLPVRVHSSALRATPAGPAADAWFSGLLGTDVRLVHLGDPRVRPVNPQFGGPDDRVSFADGYPLLLTTEASLAALNTLVEEGRGADEGPLPMARFRPNVVVSGVPAWQEDGWRRIRIGEAVFRTPKGCDRCIMTTYDPDTAERGREPLATLVRHRRWDGRSWFGMNLIPDTPGVSIAVGDELEVLAAEADPDGPPR